MSSNSCNQLGCWCWYTRCLYWTSTIKKNIPTTIFDPKDPGSMASYGNAGHFSPYAILQLNRPDILYDIPKMLFSSYGPLALKWNYVPKMIPWFPWIFKKL